MRRDQAPVESQNFLRIDKVPANFVGVFAAGVVLAWFVILNKEWNNFSIALTVLAVFVAAKILSHKRMKYAVIIGLMSAAFLFLIALEHAESNRSYGAHIDNCTDYTLVVTILSRDSKGGFNYSDFEVESNKWYVIDQEMYGNEFYYYAISKDGNFHWPGKIKKERGNREIMMSRRNVNEEIEEISYSCD